MKTLYCAIFFGLILMTSFGCKSTKKITVEESTGSVEIKQPFSEAKYKTDKDYYRATRSYLHPMQNLAKENATAQASAAIVAEIKQDLSNFLKYFTQTTELRNAQDVEGQLNTRLTRLAESIIGDIVTVDDKMFKEKDGRYTSYVVVEKSKTSVKNSAYEKIISNDDKLKIMFDKKKFDEEYENYKKQNANQ